MAFKWRKSIIRRKRVIAKGARDSKPTQAELDKLWSQVIKLRAGMKSEYKDIPGYLAAHHILGKPTRALRYNIDNGVCITVGQHKFVAHHAGRQDDFRRWALEKRGVTEEQLRLTSRNLIDMFAMKIYLETLISTYKGKECGK